MFRRKTKSKSSFLFSHSSNRGSDIVRPENTSLVVNDSDTEMDELPRELTSILSEDENLGDTLRKSSSLMKSFIQKKQSTPLSQTPRERRVLREDNSQRQKKKLSTGPRKPDSKPENMYFEEVLKECGATPLPGNGSFLMREDQAVFSIKLNDALKLNPENVKKFLKSLEELSSDSKYLQKMLIHTLTAENCEVARGPVQEPLIRMLLNVSCLQADLLELLLKEIGRVVLENKLESENVQLVASILRQMRFLATGRDVKLASKLFEIIHVASINVKREIIFLLPEIISEEEAEETCSQLVDLLKFDSALTHVIIDALTNLPLNDDLRSRVCTKVLNRLDKCSLEHLPSLVQFVLNKSKVDELPEVISGLRKNLPFTPKHLEIRKFENMKREKTNSEDSFVKLTFENLKFSLMASKQATDAWIKIVSSTNSILDFRCVDLAILIILYSCMFGKKTQIVQLLRNKVKAMVLNEIQVQNLFQVLLVVAVEYSSAILELASVFLKSFEGKISQFGALLYKQCFHHYHFYMKQTVISEILLHVGTGSPGAVNAALSILKDLCENEKEALSQHATSVNGLLVKVADLDLTQVRLLMDIVTDLAFSDYSSDGGSQEELQIFIRKQLISSKLEQCKKGIAAAIMFGKHAGKESGEEVSRFEVNGLLEMAMSSSTSEIKKSFFNDEFGTMVKESQLSKTFLEIWRKRTLSLVMESLIVKDVDVETDDFPMSLQYPLGVQEDVFVFPAVDFVIKSDKPGVVPVPVIPSTFRLVWCLGGDPCKFLPVFSASVILPDEAVYKNFSDFDEKQKKRILDTLFLCFNYLVECVNAFCAHRYYDRALLRMKHLIAVQKLIANHVPHVFGYIPPLCQSYAPIQKVAVKKKTTEKKPKRGRKRKLDESAAETSVVSIAESQKILGTAASCAPEPVSDVDRTTPEIDLRTFSGYFREIHWQIYNLLEADLTPLAGADDISLDEAALETSDVAFILEDLTCKSEQILKSTEVPFRCKSTTSAQSISPDEFIKASVKIAPSLLNKLELLSGYCENLLKSCDWVYDAKGLYSPEANDAKLAFAAGLKFLAEIVSWRDFQNSNDELLKGLFVILSRNANLGENSSVESLASEAGKYLAGFGKTVLVISGALSIVKCYQICLRYSCGESYGELARFLASAELCYEFLCRNWYNAKGKPERGSAFNQHVDFLLKTYFSSVGDKLEAVRSAAKITVAEVGGLASKDSELKTFKTVNKRNFPLLYRAMCEAVVSASSIAFSKKETDNQQQLVSWNKVIETLLILVEIAKAHSSRTILASLLKRSQSIIQLFLSKAMPVVESALRVRSVEVLSLLKCLQIVTRFLHSICCHSRITNDSVVAAHVPAIRSQCERLTLEVKGMLIANQLPLDCITIAILKNRDLKGNDIISQETLDDSDEDSELPPEDTPDPDEVLKETQESNSEDY